jgi:exonuclease III
MKQNHCDIAAITETWLKESIPDASVNIEGYQLLRRDRKHKEHGGVCLYVINDIQCKILACPYNEDREVLCMGIVATETTPSRILEHHCWCSVSPPGCK